MTEYIKCSHCGNEITPDSDFCPHCGVLFAAAGTVFCDLHTLEPGVGVCIICRKLCCEACGVRIRDRFFCCVHRKVKVEEDWAEVFRSTEISDAELVKSVLESTGHMVQGQNFNSIGFIWDGGGDSPISRSNINKPAKVFVPIPEYLDALEEIKEWRSVEEFHDDGLV
ncbi:MAG: zinc ribbon domain-containing protein [Ignavibacteriae bacterium]|nr:MAG: zinc ribbon domain-containing protein [Ignavibacteriota bacterium]